MMDERFYELYRKFSDVRSAAEGEPVIDEFALLCRESARPHPTEDIGARGIEDCLFQIVGSRTLFALAVSKWLAQEQEDLLSLAKALVRKASGHRMQQTTPEFYDLSAIPEVQSVLAGCRLCALAVTPPVSLGWVLSLAAVSSKSVETTNAIEALLRHLVEEQPWTTLRLLSSEDSPFQALEIVISALERLKEQTDWLEEQPLLRELAMTTEMKMTLASIRRNESRDIHRRSQEKSLFANLFKTQHIKYAKRTAVEFMVGSQTSEVTLDMAPISVSFEMPISERTDPVTGELVRRHLWMGVTK